MGEPLSPHPASWGPSGPGHSAPPGLTRRRLLGLLGLAGGCAAWPSRAVGAVDPPIRLLCYVSSHGTVHEDWAIRLGYRDDQDYVLSLGDAPASGASRILEPLWSHRDKLIVVDGVGYATALATDLLAHASGTATCLSGFVPRQIEGQALAVDGASLDQLFAAAQGTPFPSLEWGVSAGVGVSFGPLGTLLPHTNDPVAAWQRLFPSELGSAHPEESRQIRAGQGSVLELVAGRYGAVLPRLPAEERDKIALHRDLVRDLERRIAELDAIPCAPTAQPTAPPPPDDAGYPGHQLEAFLELAAVALSCDLTRAITLRVDDVPTATVGAPPGDLHNDIAHAVVRDPAAREWMTRHHTFHATQIARLLDTLDAIPEGSGTLLDHTIVVWSNEIATGEHRLHTVPVVIAGGTGVLQTGRYHRFAPRHAMASGLGIQQLGRPHNQLLNVLGRALGLGIDHVGARSVALAGGDRLDCTGLLPGLLR